MSWAGLAMYWAALTTSRAGLGLAAQGCYFGRGMV